VRCLAAASTCNGCTLHGYSNPWPKTFSSLILTVDLGPWFHKHNSCFFCARDADRHLDVGVLIFHHQVANDSPGGATSNSKMHELGYYSHVHCTLALMCAKNCVIIFCNLLDIWENVLLDIRENVEWPHFFWPTLWTRQCICWNLMA